MSNPRQINIEQGSALEHFPNGAPLPEGVWCGSTLMDEIVARRVWQNGDVMDKCNAVMILSVAVAEDEKCFGFGIRCGLGRLVNNNPESAEEGKGCGYAFPLLTCNVCAQQEVNDMSRSISHFIGAQMALASALRLAGRLQIVPRGIIAVIQTNSEHLHRLVSAPQDANLRWSDMMLLDTLKVRHGYAGEVELRSMLVQENAELLKEAHCALRDKEREHMEMKISFQNVRVVHGQTCTQDVCTRLSK